VVACFGMLLSGLAIVSTPTTASADVAKPQAWCDVWTALLPFNGVAVQDVALPDGSLVSAELVTVTGTGCSDADAGVHLTGATLTTPATPIHGHSAFVRSDVATPSSFGPGSFVVSNVAIGSVDLN